MIKHIIQQIRKPEYTGENRCEPCTILNLIIAIVLSIGVSRISKRGGVAMFSISAALIYLRGYLIPKTPSLTKQYLPANILRWFGKEPEPGFDAGLGTGDTLDSESIQSSTSAKVDTGQESDTDVELAPERYLFEQNVVEPCDQGDDLCLTDTFDTAWLNEIDRIETNAINTEDAARLFGIDTDEDLKIVEFGDARVMNQGDTQVGKWPSHAALIADVTAARVLSDRDPNWQNYSPERKGQFLKSVRLFLETCPTGSGNVRMAEETVESYCKSHDVIAVVCEDTGERLLEQPIDDIEA